MVIEVTTHEILSEFLRRTGRGLPGDCGENRGCGKCSVQLLTGLWESGGKVLRAPCAAVPCVTKLKSCIGSIGVPETPSAAPKVSADWDHAAPLPRNEAPVIAVDMGTTTLAAVRIEEGRITASGTALNGQCAFGDNVMTRIARSGESFGELRNALLDSVGLLLEKLDIKSARHIAVAGNTTLCCFLHGINPAPIGTAPFAAPQVRFPGRNDLWHGLPVYTVPCITGLLGGDIAGGLRECPLEIGDLFIDLGTNCEMVFRTPGELVGTSAAAGPAFEGCGISCGSRALPGAVDHWRGPGKFSVIGGGAPRSLCGSGLLDFLAEARRSGILSPAGRFTMGASLFEIAPQLTVTEGDIAELLKAKAAVAAAVAALEKHTGFIPRRLKLAGGFSRYMDPDSAKKIGMIPDLPVLSCGNLSLAGAARLACEPELLPEMAFSSGKLREIHLNDIPGFPELFTASLKLP